MAFYEVPLDTPAGVVRISGLPWAKGEGEFFNNQVQVICVGAPSIGQWWLKRYRWALSEIPFESVSRA